MWAWKQFHVNDFIFKEYEMEYNMPANNGILVDLKIKVEILYSIKAVAICIINIIIWKNSGEELIFVIIRLSICQTGVKWSEVGENISSIFYNSSITLTYSNLLSLLTKFDINNI